MNTSLSTEHPFPIQCWLSLANLTPSLLIFNAPSLCPFYLMPKQQFNAHNFTDMKSVSLLWSKNGVCVFSLCGI